jgi:hypothetical protein
MAVRVFYPDKELEKWEAGPYTLTLQRGGRLQDEPLLYNVVVRRGFAWIDSKSYVDLDKARRNFEICKEEIVLAIAREAMGLLL